MRRVAFVALTAMMTLLVSGCVTPGARWASPTSGRVTSASPTPSGSASPSGSPSTPAQWQPCPDVWKGTLDQAPANVRFDCATVKVPQDWAAPDSGKTFDIALVRARAVGQRDRVGSLVINPGGPGASGVNHAVYRSVFLPTEVTRRFDLVGFDPRGVGRSAPVKCFTDADLEASFAAEPDPVDAKDFEAAAALSRRLAQACGDRYGDTLRLYSTEQTARDLDAIRGAIGDRQLTYLGYSYGTLLGAVYAQLFPQNVRALVLDGAVDPTLPPETASEQQARGFERGFDNFANWCKNNADVCPLAPEPRAAVVDVMDRARTAPVRQGGRTATPGWIFTAVVSSLYNQASWRLLASAIDNLRRGQAGGVFLLADAYAARDASGRYSNLFDANVAINCTDDDRNPTVERIRTLQSEWRAKYPLFGAPIAVNLICAHWPGKHDPYPTGPAAGAAPILVVGTTGDPATPYEQTAGLAKMLGVGTVLTWQGEGHTAYPKTRCVTEAINRYLVDLKVPADGQTCPP